MARSHYMGISQEHAFSRIQKFIEAQNLPVLISVLWHNNELTDYFYRGMNRVYWPSGRHQRGEIL
ncbi:MAG: hypothetical protein IPL08_21495 [Saprospiraceae bacterium]|nr:hypothetical protein [Saprospiraceae bacterium]